MGKKILLMILMMIILVLILSSSILASWITLDGTFSFNDGMDAKGFSPGPNSSQSLNITYLIPFLSNRPLRGSSGVTENMTVSSKTNSFRISLALSDPIFSLQGNRSEDNSESSGVGTTATRNDFSFSFSPQEKFLPRFSYTFSESDADLGGSSNTLNFSITKDVRPGNKISMNMGYSISKNANIKDETETQDQRINFNLSANPFSNIRFSLTRDYGVNDNLSSSIPQSETIRTSYDASINPFKEQSSNPINDLALTWRRSEDFSSGANELRVSTAKSLSFGLKPFKKLDLHYDYSLSEDESEKDVVSSNNSGQNFSLTIPLSFDIDLKYNYSLRKSIDAAGLGSNSEDNGFNVAYSSPLLKGSNLTLSFTMSTDKKQILTDTNSSEQSSLSWSMNGRVMVLKIFDINFTHSDSMTKSNNHLDDQKSISDSFGTSLQYSILHVIRGSSNFNYSSRNSNTSSQTSESSDRNFSNNFSYQAGKVSLGLTLSYSESESDNVTNKKTLSPNLGYTLSSGKLNFSYSLTDRVDEDPITGILSSSRDASYNFGYAYNITSQSNFTFSYSARNHIDLSTPNSNDDGERVSANFNFKF